MRQFVSEVLDIDVYEREGSYQFELSGMTFELIEVKSPFLNLDVPQFEFELFDQKELSSLEEKVSFYYFRQEQKSPLTKSLNPARLDKEKLEVVDPDGRPWLFVIKKLEQSLSRVESISSKPSWN